MNFNENGLAPPPPHTHFHFFFCKVIHNHNLRTLFFACLEIFDKSIPPDFQFASDTTEKRTLSLFNNFGVPTQYGVRFRHSQFV